MERVVILWDYHKDYIGRIAVLDEMYVGLCHLDSFRFVHIDGMRIWCKVRKATKLDEVLE